MASINFWFSIGSTYSYLTVMRLPAVAEAQGIEIGWRPFDVRRIMKAQNNTPFVGKPEKTAYMWRDIERRAAGYGIEAALPAPYPIANLALANQVALLGLREGWGVDYVQATYRRWFQDGQPAGEAPNLPDSLREIGQDPDAVLARAESPEIVAALEAETETARDLGIFGAPSFVVGHELFWGDDRLEDAIGWLRRHRL
ncbi:2-hydroxychromene-2-carboxylate isomerase [Pseudoponticoccus marisrubri]|uniref:2-hydroxychromene-2-carboxylate isomerase n=1 Tax=Pseudoponticoccus marisrubri TaxID=1685382 RepID=A0A0W7WKF9_9RHOB|nr:2-hydroxychromene-2-carboxylate isomerase [Pseudoponticoccus marisrubri]KUF11067.1 2-hydroxychromene-2-carboxylate isomerase [Pseudoponticoccus marisrubri]